MNVAKAINSPLVITHDTVSPFDPLTEVGGLVLYLNRRDATPSSWLDQAPNNYDYAQAVVGQQPSLVGKKVVFDGSDDIQTKLITSPYVGGGGQMFYSGYHTGQTQFFHATGFAANDNNRLIFGIDSSGRTILLNRITGFTRNVRSTGAVLNIGDYFQASWRTTGLAATGWECRLNSVEETVVVTSGLNQGNWYSDCINFGGIDTTSVGGLEALTDEFTNCEINKIILSTNGNLLPNQSEVEAFMANPNS